MNEQLLLKLTPREIKTVSLVVSGKNTKEVASEMNVSVWTAQTYRQRAYEKLGINSIATLTRFALAMKLVNNEFVK